MTQKPEATRMILSAAALCMAGGAAAQAPAMKSAYEKHFGKPVQVKAAVDAPNILLITSDQQHWMFMGYNDPKCKTPNLDRLARMGVIFDRAYTVNPVSTPTRASIITGMYPSQHGAYALGTTLSEDKPVVGDDLVRGGYRTALIGKAHFQPLAGTAEFPSAEAYPLLQDLDFWRTFSGPFFGFEHVELTRNHGDESHVGQHYGVWMESKVGDQWKEWFCKPTGTSERQNGAWNIPEQYHMNVWIAERTNAMIEQYAKKKEKFFLWASFFDPHPPYLVPEPWASMYKPEDMVLPDNVTQDLQDMPLQYRVTKQDKPDRSTWHSEQEPWPVHGIGAHKINPQQIKRNMALYYGMISFMDHHIGAILDKLEKEKLLDKTLIVFTTDHGHLLGHHGLTAKGAFDYEDAIKIPFIAAYKGHMPAGKRDHSLQSIVDLAPTFLSFAGLPIPWQRMSGVDQKPVWEGKAASARSYVIVENRFQPTKFYVRTYIEERYKITYDMNSDEGELFDLQEDPGEMHNLWDKPEYKDLKAKMLLRALQGDMRAEPGMPRLSGA